MSQTKDCVRFFLGRIVYYNTLVLKYQFDQLTYYNLWYRYDLSTKCDCSEFHFVHSPVLCYLLVYVQNNEIY